MSGTDAARIRPRAHEIWMDEGTPGGPADANWLQAERELASACPMPRPDKAASKARPKRAKAAHGRWASRP